ncbi:MAG: hypothetical protein QXP98_08785 [Thermoproteus sp.]
MKQLGLSRGRRRQFIVAGAETYNWLSVLSCVVAVVEGRIEGAVVETARASRRLL